MAIASLAAISISRSRKESIEVPAFGGEYIEGILGQPRYINPVLEDANEIDSSISHLIFSGLFKYASDGKLAEDIAESLELSEDKKTYSVKIKENIYFHDGEKLTADDVVFTAQIIANPDYNSPLKESLQSVQFEADGEYIVKFILKEAYSLFAHNLTFGILPKHIWEGIHPANFSLAEGNLKPIGSGPFALKKLSRNKNGFIGYINLERFEEYFAQKPFLENVTFKFYSSGEDLLIAYNNKEILGTKNLPEKWEEKINKDSSNIFKARLSQYFGIFFNLNSNKTLQDPAARNALSLAIDKKSIIENVFNGEPFQIDLIPFPETFNNLPGQHNPESASAILEEAGWKDSDGDSIREKEGIKLEFSLATLNQPHLEQTALAIQKDLEKIGAKINVEIKNFSEINSLIKERGYEAILFGQTLGIAPDPYAFWHSSQKDYPGLNLSLFSNPESDRILENIRIAPNNINGEELASAAILEELPKETAAAENASISIKQTEKTREDLYADLQNILAKENPAIFLFSPASIFVINNKIKGVEIEDIYTPSGHFSEILNWHIKTKYERRNKVSSETN